MDEGSGRPKALLKTGRGWLLAITAAVVGFVIAMVIYGAPWHRSAAWGDVPTWLLAGGAGVTAWLALLQLRDLREWLAKEAIRNDKRDQLLDKQIAEAERRERSERRRVVEGVKVRFSGGVGRVENNSGRPINDITAKVMSKVDRHSLRTPSECGEAAWDGHTWRPVGAKPVSRIETLRPEAACVFVFEGLRGSPDEALVAWFTDDDGFRWQLDEYQHLAESDDENEWVPLRVPQPLAHNAPDAIGSASAGASAALPPQGPAAPGSALPSARRRRLGHRLPGPDDPRARQDGAG